ncbi:MAG: prepilin-type N-terminal cleavage/methylation domain-containing protein [Treponema sp.]|jgi:prepilin-type N-terminal cleavage/methylation domain-containing protein|nr:prepilin-type N-terminal cleavage/methylation domain-containing protein [Treponema sp.]
MNQNSAGFTLMETLLSVAIILVISSLIAIGSGTALQGASKSIKTVKTAATLTRIDRFIRTKTNAVHIPYWAAATPYIDALTAELYRSKIGTYIKSVGIIDGYLKVPLGIEVVYKVNNREMKTVALFPSVAVIDVVR